MALTMIRMWLFIEFEIWYVISDFEVQLAYLARI